MNTSSAHRPSEARGENQTLTKELKGQKGMDVEALVKQAIAGIESGKTEIRPGLSNILYILSRIAPQYPFWADGKDAAYRVLVEAEP